MPDFGIKLERQLGILEQESKLVPCFPEKSLKYCFFAAAKLCNSIDSQNHLRKDTFQHSLYERYCLIFRSSKRFSIAALRNHQRWRPTDSAVSEPGDKWENWYLYLSKNTDGKFWSNFLEFVVVLGFLIWFQGKVCVVTVTAYPWLPLPSKYYLFLKQRKFLLAW